MAEGFRATRRGRARGEGGSALVLFPAAVLVMVILGSIAVDLSLAYASTRRVADLAASWANDAANAIDPASHYRDGAPIELDPAMAARWVGQRCVAADVADPAIDLDCSDLRIRIDGASVTVEVSGEIPLLFLDAIPNVGAPRRVTASSTAALVTLD